jgi:hypothetical protein
MMPCQHYGIWVYITLPKIQEWPINFHSHMPKYLTKKVLYLNVPISVAFIDYIKAFDKRIWNKL